MANIYGDNYTKEFINQPSERSNVGEVHAKVKALYDQKSGGVAADVLTFGKLPANALVLALGSVGAGASPVFNVAAGDKPSSETVLTCTLGVGPAATSKVWVLYSID
jgi:hypothetical protein